MTSEQKRQLEMELNRAYQTYTRALAAADASRSIMENTEANWRFVCGKIWRKEIWRKA